MTDAELAAAPAAVKSKAMTGMPGMNFVMTISTLDCTGCGSCVQVCPGMKGNKALAMSPIDNERPGQEVFDYGVKLDPKPEVLAKFKDTTVKGSQFKQPLLEFSGACGGCGETPYAKLVTQLFGDKMYHCKCYRLLLHLGRFRTGNAVHRQQAGSRPGMAELPV